ncbi:MAG: hypothetical protein NXI32_01370 [bacterium]|nr:hypothetical protein [bacterium]
MSKPLWDIYAHDLQTGAAFLLWEGLSREEFIDRWLLWDPNENNAVLIPFPQGVEPPLKIEHEDAI